MKEMLIFAENLGGSPFCVKKSRIFALSLRSGKVRGQGAQAPAPV